MGQLHETVKKIDQVIAQKKLDAVKTRGSIGLKSGFLLSLVNASTPDDANKINALRKAAKEVLGEDM